MKRYYKLCLFSPLWLPVLLGLLGVLLQALVGDLDDLLPEWIGVISVIIFASIFFGGLQYVMALYIVWSRIDFESMRSWSVGVLWLPIIFTIIQVITMVPFLWSDLIRGQGLEVLGAIALVDLGLGYGYALCWFLGVPVIRVIKSNRKEIVV